MTDYKIIINAEEAVTKNIGFAPTYSATYTQPYQLARDFSTLDHLTKGRVAWNIVTSYLRSEAINLGLEEQMEHDTRYKRADEYMEVVYKLWEQSWEDDAIIADEVSGVYADSNKVHPINHQGDFFSVPGVHLVEPSPQRSPVLFQAGASEKGKDFAAKHAEAIFTTLANDISELKTFVTDIRERAKEAGRNPEDIKVFLGIVPIVGVTEEEAKLKYKELTSYVSYEGILALLSGHTGVDFSQYDPDELELMVNEGDADGFNIIQAASPGTFEDFIELVVPILQERGSFRKEYEASTLRENLFGKGHVHLPGNHPAKKVSLVSAAKI